MFEAPSEIRSATIGPGGMALAYAPLAQIDFRKIRSALWRGKTTILLSTALALAAAVLFLLIAPHQFTATTQILIDPTDLHALQNELKPASQVSDVMVLQVESQVRVLTSDAVLRRVIKEENLAADPEFAGSASLLRKLAADVLSAVGITMATPTADASLAALDELKRRVQVKRAERTYVVDVSVTSKDPEKAARIANAIAQAYLAEQTLARANSASQVSRSMTARLDELKERVREAEERVEAFKARNNILGVNGQLVNEQQLTDLNNQLSTARGRMAEAKARLDQIVAVQKAKGAIGAFPEALQSQTITALRSQYAEVMRREAEQMTSLGPRHPAVIEIQAQGERLHRMIEDEVNRIAISAQTEYDSAKADEAILAANLEALKHTAIATNESLVGLRELERDVQASRAVYEAFLVRARETGEQSQLDTKDIRIISKAELPQRRSSPPSSILVALAAIMLGVGAGTGIVLLRVPYDDTAPRPVERRMPGGISERKAKKNWHTAMGTSGIPVLAVLPDVDISFGLNAAEDPKSPFAAEIRKVYAAVRSSHTNGGNPSILVVASDDEDDTAAVALTLAAVAAPTQHVLLIDADLQRRTLSALDADRNDAGLVDVATGRRRLADVIVRDRETNINLVSFVSPNSRRDRHISDADVRQAFEETKRFDIVIVAAMDLSRDPSTRFFAGLVDHIVLVARADERDEHAARKTIARLGIDARKVRGAVLTGVGAA
jgi:polysaccharide biosynthesis transport protein